MTNPANKRSKFDNYERNNADSGYSPLDLVKYFEAFFD